MKGVFLDSDTLGKKFSFDPLLTLPIDWTFYPQTSNDQIVERSKEADIVITNKVVFTKDALQKLPKLKLLAQAATGYNNIDITAAKKLSILVCNVPSYSTPCVVQLVMTFILSLASNHIRYMEDVKQGKWEKQPLFTFLDYPIIELKGKKLGIIGYGSSGKALAVLAKGFGMEVIIASYKSVEGGLPLQQVIEEADFLTLHIPLNEKTNNLITRNEIEKMKPTAFLINAARGGIVNEKDLADCLKEGIIAGAAVDVLSEEPPRNGNPLLDPLIPNLLLTPHIGWGSLEARLRLVEKLKENIDAYLKGKPKNLV